MLKRDVDAYGRVSLDPNSLCELLCSGKNIKDVYAEPGSAIDQFNALCKEWDKLDYIVETPEVLKHSPAEEHARRQTEWLFPEKYQTIDVRSHVLAFCTDQKQIDRVNAEMLLYEKYELIPVLQLMIFLVDHFRTNKVVFGVGRGSSVASYVLFLIGIHKIDSLRYGLEIEDFLREE